MWRYLKHLWRVWQLSPVPSRNGHAFWYIVTASKDAGGRIVPTGERSVLWTDYRELIADLRRTRPGCAVTGLSPESDSEAWLDVREDGSEQWYVVQQYR